MPDKKNKIKDTAQKKNNFHSVCRLECEDAVKTKEEQTHSTER